MWCKLENRAIAAAPTELRCAVERAGIAGDRATDGVGTIATASKPIEYCLGPSLAIGRCQLENGAKAKATTSAPLDGRTVKHVIMDDKAIGIGAVATAQESVEYCLCPSGLAFWWWRQLKKCAKAKASVASAAATSCTVERTTISN
jgi:hypothetical protein